MINRRSFVKSVTSTTAGLVVGSSMSFGKTNPDQKISLPSPLPDNPLVLFDNFHRGKQTSYSWKSKFAAARHAGFDGFEFMLVDPESDSWKEAMDHFWDKDFNLWGFHWSTQAVIDENAPTIDQEIDKIVKNIEALAKMPQKPYFTLSLSGRGELTGPTIQESGSAKAEERHWQRAYKIIAAFDKACGQYGINGSLYPHIHWICDTPQSVFKILDGAQAKTIGPAFCSHHWYANSASDAFDEFITNSWMKRLNYSVLTNGSFSPSSFKAVRFNEGEIDMAWMLAKLYQINYQGPISSQGWGIGGDPFVACKQFVDTIRALRKRFTDHPDLYPLA